MRSLDRRTFLLRSAGLLGGVVLGSPLLRGLGARRALAATGKCLQAAEGEGGYGPLQAAGPELALPAGFTYRRFSLTGTPMSDGRPTPSAHDGMAAFPLRNGHIRLVRDLVSLSGTIMNCAGGPTPWGSWLSCEESTQGGAPLRRPHGYCFEVPARANEEVHAEPLKALGRFVREAVAIDPATGFVYETEDQSDAGFYRFIPSQPGVLAAGGRLQMLAIAGTPNYDTSEHQHVGQPLPVSWVDILDPDPADAEANPSAVFHQGFAQGAARFRRLEGCSYGDGSIFFNSTSGGGPPL